MTHEVSITRRPTSWESYTVRCTCGFAVGSPNKADAKRVEEHHLKRMAEKEKS